MKRLGTFGFFMLLTASSCLAQLGGLRLVSASVCTGVVETPVLVSQIQGIASMSIKMIYDTNAVSYMGVRSVHPSIANGIITATNSRFVIAWFSLQPINIASDTLLVIRWAARQQVGQSNLQFDTQTPGNCEMANVQGQVVPMQYLSGSVAITGPQAPLPLNPLQLSNLNQSSYLFVYNRRPCQQSVVLQMASDSVFSQTTLLTTMPDTTFRYFFSGIQPAQGDSLRWWRMGGVFGGDTAWSALGRMSFAMTLNQSNMDAVEQAKLYPNPFSQSFYVRNATFGHGMPVTLRIYTIHGKLLEELELISEQDGVLVEIKNTNYYGQLLINWQNSAGRGLLLGNKIGY